MDTVIRLFKFAFMMQALSQLLGNIKVQAADVRNGLVLDMPMNGDVCDVSGLGNVGELSPNIANATGVYGQANTALRFDDALSTFVRIPNSNDFSGSNGFTMSAWVNPTTVSGAHAFFSKRNDLMGQQSYMLKMIGNRFRLEINNPGVNFVTANNLPVNSWSHIVATHDSGSSNLYLNGMPVGSASMLPTVNLNNLDLYLGAFVQGGSVLERFSGLMDNVRFYNTSISGTQVLELYNFYNNLTADPAPLYPCSNVTSTTAMSSTATTNLAATSGSTAAIGLSTATTNAAGTSGSTATTGMMLSTGSPGPIDIRNGLVLDMPMDSGSAADFSGRANHGIALSGVTPATGFDGEVNTAFDFDGAGNGYIRVPHSNDFNAVSGFTIGAWIKLRTNAGAQAILAKWDDFIPLRSYNFKYYSAAQIGVNNLGLPGEVRSNGGIPVNIWTYVTATYDNSRLAVFVNGFLSNAESYSMSINQGNQNITIGSITHSIGFVTERFNGCIDNLRFYNRSLSDAEIYSLYYNFYLNNSVSLTNAATTGTASVTESNAATTSFFPTTGSKINAANSSNGREIPSWLAYAIGAAGPAVLLICICACVCLIKKNSGKEGEVSDTLPVDSSPGLGTQNPSTQRANYSTARSVVTGANKAKEKGKGKKKKRSSSESEESMDSFEEEDEESEVSEGEESQVEVGDEDVAEDHTFAADENGVPDDSMAAEGATFDYSAAGGAGMESVSSDAAAFSAVADGGAGAESTTMVADASMYHGTGSPALFNDAALSADTHQVPYHDTGAAAAAFDPAPTAVFHGGDMSGGGFGNGGNPGFFNNHNQGGFDPNAAAQQWQAGVEAWNAGAAAAWGGGWG